MNRITIVGLGGLGSFVSYSIINFFDEIEIVDFDLVEEKNLDRQILYDYNSINEYKVDIAYKRLKSINPNVKIIKARKDIREYKPTGNIIIDCVDNFEIKKYLDKLNKPVLHLSVKNKYGFVYFYHPKYNYPLEKIVFGKLDEKENNINSIMIVAGIGMNLLLEYIKNKNLNVFKKFIVYRYPYYIREYKIKK